MTHPRQIHNELVLLGLRWLRRRSSIAFSGLATVAWEIPDAIGWQRGTSTIIECKVSRSDFLADAKKPFRCNPELGMGRLRYYLCPAEVIHVDDLPEKWGLLWIKGSRVFKQHGAEAFLEIALHSEIQFLVSVLRRVQLNLGTNELAEMLKSPPMPKIVEQP